MRKTSYRGVSELSSRILRGIDRRRACRYSASMATAVIKWTSADKGENEEMAVAVENISNEGCLVRSRKLPGAVAGKPIWFHVPELPQSGWMEGTVVSKSKPFLRKAATRIRFSSPIPFEVFKRLAYGSVWIVKPTPEPVCADQ